MDLRSSQKQMQPGIGPRRCDDGEREQRPAAPPRGLGGGGAGVGRQQRVRGQRSQPHEDQSPEDQNHTDLQGEQGERGPERPGGKHRRAEEEGRVSDRYYGNRSYCYWCLEQYSSALADAQRSIQLAPDWPMGYFRKGGALMGLKRFSEAEAAMEQVLKLDQTCKEASSKLRACRVLQLTELGFEEEQSKALLEKFTTVQAVAASPEARTLKQDQSGSCRSLWVGNITLEVTEKDVLDLFQMVGEIESVRVLHERFCAFVNFRNANMAAKALEKLQGAELGSSKLVVRYPDRWTQRTAAPLQRTSSSPGPTAAGLQSSAAPGSRRCVPIYADECFYWRNTGCFYGDKCRFKHIPDQQGRDKKPWQP